jgi:valyl-tRNA synthetase
MMMMGIHFMKEVPFKDVYIHALVRDENGQKMSKSKGNVIDPLTVIDEYGADAFRFTLAAFAAQGRDIKMSEKRVEGYRHFMNKLWNAARFSLMYIQEAGPLPSQDGLSTLNRWILSRLCKIAASVEKALDTYRFNDAAGDVYRFIWHEFCDWYLEGAKPSLNGLEGEDQKQQSAAVLAHVMEQILIIMHPFSPFITEEIWSHLPQTTGSVSKARFPEYPPESAPTDETAEGKINLVMSVITGIRNIRGEMNILPSLPLQAVVDAENEFTLDCILEHQGLIVNLARLSDLSVSPGAKRPKGSASAVVEKATVFIPLQGVVDFSQEVLRLEKEIAKVSGELEKTTKKLNNEDFLTKAPEDVVAKVREKAALLSDKSQKLTVSLDRIKTLVNS